LQFTRPSVPLDPWPDADQEAADAQSYDLGVIQNYLEHRHPKYTLHYERVVDIRFEDMRRTWDW